MRLDREHIGGLAAITLREVISERVAIMAPAALKDMAPIMAQAAIMGMEIIMGTAGTTGMEIPINLVFRSVQDGADGDQGGGVPRPMHIIHTTRTTLTIQRHLSLSNNSPRHMFSRTSKNQVTGTTARIPKVIIRTSNPVLADG